LTKKRNGQVILTIWPSIISQSIVGNVITPPVQKKMINLPPALTFISQILMGVFSGALGIILAVPLLAILNILVDEFYSKKTILGLKITAMEHTRFDGIADMVLLMMQKRSAHWPLMYRLTVNDRHLEPLPRRTMDPFSDSGYLERALNLPS